MKIKKILALLLSVSMLACLSACSSDDSSSSKKDAAIQTEKIEADEESKLAEEEAKVTEALTEVDANEAAAEIAGNYDSEHPEDTVLALLQKGFETSFKDHMRTDYDASTGTYTTEVWQAGFAAALETQQGKSALDSLRSTLESSLNTMTTQVRNLDPNANIRFSFVNDEDQKTPILTLDNGTTVYDITQE